jgi:hypothetical protein
MLGCRFIDEPDGAVCNDGIACTSGDVCSTGSCRGVDACPVGERCDEGLNACLAEPAEISMDPDSVSSQCASANASTLQFPVTLGTRGGHQLLDGVDGDLVSARQ